MDISNTPTANKFVFRCYFASSIISVWLIKGSVPRKANSFNTPAQAPSSLEIHLQKHFTFLERVDGIVFS